MGIFHYTGYIYIYIILVIDRDRYIIIEKSRTTVIGLSQGQL